MCLSNNRSYIYWVLKCVQCDAELQQKCDRDPVQLCGQSKNLHNMKKNWLTYLHRTALYKLLEWRVKQENKRQIQQSEHFFWLNISLWRLNTNQLHEAVLPEKLTDLQLVKKSPAFHETRRFIAALKTARHVSLSWARSIQSMPPYHFYKICFNIILPSMAGSSMWPPPFRFPHQNPVCTSTLPQTCYMLCPSHSSWFDHPNDIWWAVQSIKCVNTSQSNAMSLCSQNTTKMETCLPYHTTISLW